MDKTIGRYSVTVQFYWIGWIWPSFSRDQTHWGLALPFMTLEVIDELVVAREAMMSFNPLDLDGLKVLFFQATEALILARECKDNEEEMYWEDALGVIEGAMSEWEVLDSMDA